MLASIMQYLAEIVETRHGPYSHYALLPQSRYVNTAVKRAPTLSYMITTYTNSPLLMISGLINCYHIRAVVK